MGDLGLQLLVGHFQVSLDSLQGFDVAGTGQPAGACKVSRPSPVRADKAI